MACSMIDKKAKETKKKQSAPAPVSKAKGSSAGKLDSHPLVVPLILQFSRGWARITGGAFSFLPSADRQWQ